MWCELVISMVVMTVGLSQAKPAGLYAECNVQPNPKGSSQQVNGQATFYQKSESDKLQVTISLCGFNRLPKSANASAHLHGCHVHQTGNISGGCENSGGHYNPDNVNHGGRDATIRHAGDFGNIRQNSDGFLIKTFIDPVATLFGEKSILGRALVIHEKEDDLGLGGNPSSLLNGNAGARLACCVITKKYLG